MVVPILSCNEATVYLRVNGVADKYYDIGGNSKEYLASMANRDNTYYHLIRLFGTGGQVVSIHEYAGYAGNGSAQYGILRSNSGVTPATVQTLNFVTSDGATMIEAGSKIAMYGVRL